MGAPHYRCTTCLTQVQEPQLAVTGDVGTRGYKVISFPISWYINICRNVDMYITTTLNAKEKTTGGIAWSHGGVGRVKF
jgi:hypothetical protein